MDPRKKTGYQNESFSLNWSLSDHYPSNGLASAGNPSFEGEPKEKCCTSPDKRVRLVFLLAVIIIILLVIAVIFLAIFIMNASPSSSSVSEVGVIQSSSSSPGVTSSSSSPAEISSSSTFVDFASSSILPTSAQASLSMENINGFDNQTIILVCKLEGNYTFSNVVFFKDGKILNGQVHINDDKIVFNYTLTDTECTDSGQYRCIVTGEETNLTATANVTITVLPSKPTVTIPYEIVEKRYKEASKFICQYKQGIPAAEVFWTATLTNGRTVTLGITTTNDVEVNQTDQCSLEAVSTFYHGFELEYNASSICCVVKQGETTKSTCENIYIIEDSFCDNKTGLQEHPYSCNLWIQCINDIVYMSRCGKGQCIDINLQQCVLDGPPTQPLESPNEFSCTGRSFAYIPHETTFPNNCKDYQWCVNGIGYNQTCARKSFLANNTSDSPCTNEYADSYCAHRRVKPSMCECADKQYIPSTDTYPDNCSTYVRCVNNVKHIGNCPEGLFVYYRIYEEQVICTQMEADSYCTKVTDGVIEDCPVNDFSSSILPTSAQASLSMENINSFDNQTITLVCKLKGNYTFTNVVFFKDGKILNGQVHVNDDKTVFNYTLTDTECTDSGQYRCMLTGEETNLTATANVTITVLPSKPTVTVPFEIVEKRYKEASKFICQYKQGIPSAEVSWTATLTNGSTVTLGIPMTNDVQVNQTDQCSLEAVSTFYHGFELEYNASSICCVVKQGETTKSTCENIYIIEERFCENKTGWQEHPHSCNVWIECINDIVYMSRCGKGQCIDINLQQCVLGEPTEPLESPNEFSCTGQPKEYIPHETTFPNKCQDYQRCIHGNGYNLTCPGTSYLANDTSDSVCTSDYADSYCAHRQGSSDGPNVTTVKPSKCDCADKQYIPSEDTYPDNCSTYVRCVHNVKHVNNCSVGLFVDYRIYEDQVTCTQFEADSYCRKVTDGVIEDCG